MANEVATVEMPAQVSGLVELALREKVPVEVLKDLVALQERVTARAARIAFFEALHRFKTETPPVPKTKAIAVETDGTKRVRSRYAPLDVIAEHIREGLHKNGLMYHWSSVVEGNDVEIFCHVTHVEGHTETSSFRFQTKDAAAPKMNGVQIAGSARTYGERYSLIQALGLTTADVDDDGQSAGDAGEPVSVEQEGTLRAMIRETGSNEKKFAEFFEVDSIGKIPARDYTKAVRLLEERRAKARAAS